MKVCERHMKDRTTDARARQEGWQQSLGNKFTCQSCFQKENKKKYQVF